MNGLLFVGGLGPTRQALADSLVDAPFIVAADSGLELALGTGVLPDLVVGDMDSLYDKRLLGRFPPGKILRFPREKDETDTEIGMRVLRERGCLDVTIAGGGGGRIDHLIGILLLFERVAPPRRWLTDQADIRLIEGKAEFPGWKGSIVSLFPVGERASDMRSEGLRWPLDGLAFNRGYGGISNLVTGEVARISVGTGKLLLVRMTG